jgi:hypothetical protein
MELYTQDHPAFIDEDTVTWRSFDGSSDTSTPVTLTGDTWVTVRLRIGASLQAP